MDRLTLQALRNAMVELSESKDILKNFIRINNGVSDQVDLDFYSFILKRALFIDEASSVFDSKDILNQLLSDLFDIVRYSSLQDYRPYYLSVRSFVENFIRFLENEPLSDNHITLTLLEKFKDDFSKPLSTGDGYAFIRSEYRVSSTIIHYHRTPTNSFNDIPTITIFFRNILESPVISRTERGALYERFSRLYKIMEKCLIFNHSDQIAAAFLRRSANLTWFIGKDNSKKVFASL